MCDLQKNTREVHLPPYGRKLLKPNSLGLLEAAQKLLAVAFERSPVVLALLFYSTTHSRENLALISSNHV